MENGPKIRIIGNADDDTRVQLEQEILKNLNTKGGLNKADLEKLKDFEIEKTEKELVLIHFADQEISHLMKEAGVEPYSVPSDNYRLFSSDLYDKYFSKNSNATARLDKQGVIFNADNFRNKPVYFGSVATHEMVHLKSHLSMELNNDGAPRATPYREGVSIKALQRDGFNGNYHEHFSGLHEAIVSETQKRLFGKMLNLPELQQEKLWLESKEAQIKKENLANKKGWKEDNIIWVGKNNDEDWEMLSYMTQREVLSYICNEISNDDQEKYSTPDAVYKEFLKAQFTGHLTTIARIVEKSFGEGSFRILGDMKTTKSSGLEYLKKMKELRAGK